MSIQYGPITRWPGKLRRPDERIRAPFRGGHASTIEQLEKELRAVSADAAVVQLAIHPKQFRRDGRPFADAEPEHPGVIVSFRKRVRNATTGQVTSVPLSFPADRFTTWEANLRAVAIGLEDLRRIDRYGITSNSEQYLGFKALPPPGPSHESIGTVEDAAAFLAVSAPFGGQSGNPALLIRDAEAYREAYRRAAALLHPDAPEAKADPAAAGKWSLLQAAKTLLDDLHQKGCPA